MGQIHQHKGYGTDGRQSVFHPHQRSRPAGQRRWSIRLVSPQDEVEHLENHNHFFLQVWVLHILLHIGWRDTVFFIQEDTFFQPWKSAYLSQYCNIFSAEQSLTFWKERGNFEAAANQFDSRMQFGQLFFESVVPKVATICSWGGGGGGAQLRSLTHKK